MGDLQTIKLSHVKKTDSCSFWIKRVRGFDAKSRAVHSNGSETRINVSARSAEECRTFPQESQRLLITDDSVIIFGQTDPKLTGLRAEGRQADAQRTWCFFNTTSSSQLQAQTCCWACRPSPVPSEFRVWIYEYGFGISCLMCPRKQKTRF